MILHLIFKTSFARNKQYLPWNTLWVKELFSCEKSRDFIWHMEQASCGRVDIFWGNVQCIVSRPHSHAAHKLYLADTTCLAGRSRSRERNRRRGSGSVLFCHSERTSRLLLHAACCTSSLSPATGATLLHFALCTSHFVQFVLHGAKVLCHFYLATRKYSLKVEI